MHKCRFRLGRFNQGYKKEDGASDENTDVYQQQRDSESAQRALPVQKKQTDQGEQKPDGTADGKYTADDGVKGYLRLQMLARRFRIHNLRIGLFRCRCQIGPGHVELY